MLVLRLWVVWCVLFLRRNCCLRSLRVFRVDELLGCVHLRFIDCSLFGGCFMLSSLVWVSSRVSWLKSLSFYHIDVAGLNYLFRPSTAGSWVVVSLSSSCCLIIVFPCFLLVCVYLSSLFDAAFANVHLFCECALLRMVLSPIVCFCICELFCCCFLFYAELPSEF